MLIKYIFISISFQVSAFMKSSKHLEIVTGIYYNNVSRLLDHSKYTIMDNNYCLGNEILPLF